MAPKFSKPLNLPLLHGWLPHGVLIHIRMTEELSSSLEDSSTYDDTSGSFATNETARMPAKPMLCKERTPIDTNIDFESGQTAKSNRSHYFLVSFSLQAITLSCADSITNSSR